MRWFLALAVATTVSCTNDPNDPIAKGEAKLQAPAWRSVKVDPAVRAVLGPAARLTVDRAPVPVLVPRALASKATVMSDLHWAAVHIGHDELTISIQASDVAFLHEDVPAMQGNKTIRGAKGWVTQNEGIWSASWSESGVAFTMEVECARPDEPRCADDSTLLKLASDLVSVGGAGVSQ